MGCGRLLHSTARKSGDWFKTLFGLSHLAEKLVNFLSFVLGLIVFSRQSFFFWVVSRLKVIDKCLRGSSSSWCKTVVAEQSTCPKLNIRTCAYSRRGNFLTCYGLVAWISSSSSISTIRHLLSLLIH